MLANIKLTIIKLFQNIFIIPIDLFFYKHLTTAFSISLTLGLSFNNL
jgi:hypothetical protein